MPITIKLPTPLRRHTEQTRSVSLAAATVGQALAELTARYPALQPALFASPGELKSFVRIYVGSRDIADLQALDTPLGDGDVVSIVPPVAGA